MKIRRIEIYLFYFYSRDKLRVSVFFYCSMLESN